MERLIRIFERGVLYAAQLLLVVVILVAVVLLWYLLMIAVRDRLGDLNSIPLLTEAVQRSFSGVLLIILGLELLETIRVYFEHRRVRLEIILVVAIIAIARHVINVDFEHVEGGMLAGIAALIVALTGGYYLVRRSGSEEKRQA
jgi:uncharacterized membrane protein (DUF373 family)